MPTYRPKTSFNEEFILNELAHYENEGESYTFEETFS